MNYKKIAQIAQFETVKGEKLFNNLVPNTISYDINVKIVIYNQR